MKKIFAAALCIAVMLSLAACGGTSAPAETESCTVQEAAEDMEAAETTEINVSTVTEFLDAIAPGASIRLSEGIYNLTDAKGFGGKNISDHYYWDSMGDGSLYALVIEDVAGLTISGCEGAEIVTDCSWADVLSFNHCDNLTIKGVHAGHTEQAESCEGRVISLTNCDNATLENCDLYGCGTIGVEAYQCWNLKITGSSIHHCSTGAVSFYDGKHAYISECSIYNCGQSADSPWSCFSLGVGDAADVKITGCSVKNSSFVNLISGYFEPEAVAVERLDVSGNNFESFFGFDGELIVNDLALADNTINKWHDNWCAPRVILDGKACSDEDLDEVFGLELSSNEVKAEPVDIITEGTKTVHVSTADEFINAIASDTLIIIDSEQIDLSTAKSYGKDAVVFWDYPQDSYFSGRNWVWEQVYDGYALWIGNVTNLHIQGGKIVTAPRYANVLSFYMCSGFSVNGTTLGHLEGSECAGGVVYLYSCSDGIIESCELYGCGIYGVETRFTGDLHLQNNYIHDCSYGAAVFSYSNNVTCLNTEVVGCPSPAITVECCDNFIWEDKIMAMDCVFDPDFYK